MADPDRLTDLLADTILPPTSPEAAKAAAVARLTDLAGMRGTTLTEEEWADFRRSVLDGLATDAHPESAFLAMAALMAGLGVVLAGYCAWVGAWQWAGAAVGGIVIAAGLGWRLRRALAAKRRLTPGDRLDVVAELVARGLVSPDEAADLRTRIANLGAGPGGTDPTAGS